MIVDIIAVIAGLVLLVWSADKFVEGAANVAKYLGMSPLLIGMLIVGFGTSAPEMVVSALAAVQGNPGLALGNAFGSNIANIALILGATALISPILVKSSLLKKELPVLLIITAVTIFLVSDLDISRVDSFILLGMFFVLMIWSIILSKKQKIAQDNYSKEVIEEEETIPALSKGKSWFWLLVGLVVLTASSRLLVYGAVNIASSFGVSEMIIGLTIVAVGTSLPELASSIAAARKGEHDIALGNIIGSNIFNTLAVIGIAGSIHPFTVDENVMSRDILLMGALTVLLFFFGISFKGRPPRINRWAGIMLLTIYILYTIYLISIVISSK